MIQKTPLDIDPTEIDGRRMGVISRIMDRVEVKVKPYVWL